MSSQAISQRYEILETTPGADTPPFLVSKARDKEEGRVVALLVLPADALGAAQSQFQAAVRQAQEIEDDGVLRVYDQGIVQETGELYVSREYIRGIALQERIRRIAPFSLTVATDIAAAVAESLAAAHRAGVAHGDLRPRCILLSPEGQIKVADFAYGAVAAACTQDTARPAYQAPELGHEDTSFAGDIYALGAILYEMLTGVSPLVGGTRVSSPRAINPGVPPALDGIVQKALHMDLSVRYRSASALLSDLQAVREALRAGKSLAWSPLTQKTGERRIPRPAIAASVSAMPSSQGTAAGAITAAQELDEERAGMQETEKRETEKRETEKRGGGRHEREPVSVLGIATSIMFVIAILGVIGLTWYLTKFMQPPNDVQVPNLIGKTFDDAKRIAEQQHFTLVESPGSDYSDTMPENQIYEQNPLAGHVIKADKEVTVFRSLGPRLLIVPDLVGTTQDHATQALESTKFPSPGSVTQEFSETVPAGIIIRQSPERNSKVARNTAVNFVVSKGRQPPDTPTQVQSVSSGPDKVDLNWQAAPRAESYTILRSLDGDVVTVARALAATHFTDTGLKPDTTYSYTVNAINSAGESGPSESSLVTTPPKVDTPPVLPPNTVVTPPADGTATGSDMTLPDQPKTASLRQFTIEFRVPRRPRHTRHVQIEIQDTTGTNLVYDENHEPGETVSAPVQGIGHKVTFRIFLDNKLVKQQTF